MSENSDKYSGRRWHDVGGEPAGPIPDDQHDFSLWEKRIDALLVLCNTKGIFHVDGLRRALEDLPAESFEEMTYYERWISSVNQNLIEAGIYSTAELAQKMTDIKSRGETYGEASNA